MAMTRIERFREMVAESGVLADPQVGEGFVYGKARLPAADADINLNIDPEIDDADNEDAALVAATRLFLSIDPTTWRGIVEAIAAEVEEAVGGVSVLETTDLRDDLRICSAVIFADSVLLSFAAPRQFPGCWIRAQLGEGMEVEDIAVDASDDVETVEFNSLDGLLDQLSSDESR